MPRLQIVLPAEFPFSTVLPVRITDLNYGGHLGNDAVLSFIHEARMRFLQQLGYTEMNAAGAGLIMSEAAVVFKQEAFYGDDLKIYIAAADFSRVGFYLYYKVVKLSTVKEADVAIAKTGMVCYDYANKKVISVPDILRTKLGG